MPTSAVEPAPSSTEQLTVVHEGQYRLPPGLPRNLPFYAAKPWLKIGDPIRLFNHLTATYGRASQYRIGRDRIVLLNHPSLVHDVLINKPASFIKERTQRRMRILLGDGLITSEGAFHMRQRRIAAPAFHRQRIQAYADGMVERASQLRGTWQSGVEMDIAGEMMTLSLEVVARTLFASDVTDEVRSINDDVNQIMSLYSFLVLVPMAEKLLHLPVPGLRQFMQARKHLDSVVSRMIEKNRQEGLDRGDLLSMLIAARDDESDHAGMTGEQLRDEVITIFLAGYETMANALTWTWYLLSQSPAAEASMHAEIDSVLAGRVATLADLPQLRYTEMVLAESMRLFPPAWAMGRQATADVAIGPYLLPAGTYVFFSQYFIHRDPEFFPDPLRFEPERFSSEQKAERPRFAYFPFGGGGRQCIGEAFAWMEGVLLLATIAQKWTLRMVPGHRVEVQPKITLRPKYGMRMIATAR